MWIYENLTRPDRPQACVNDKWVDARPENYKKGSMTLIERFKNAWEVFMCRAEAFTWPEGQ